jgi:GTP-binding protein
VLLLDLASIEGTSPREQERVLLDELGRYRPDLLDRPRLVVGSKADVAPEDADYPEMRLSAVTREGLDRFLGTLGEMVDEARAAEPVEEGFVVLRPAEEGFSVVRDDDGAFRVRGRAAERVVAMADMTNPEALAYVQERFRRMGVERALTRAGAHEGDVVRIGDVELEFVEGFA